MKKMKHSFSWEMQARNSAKHTHTFIPRLPPPRTPSRELCKTSQKSLLFSTYNNQVFITGKFHSATGKSLKQMKYEASLFPDLPQSRIFSQQPGSNCSAFHTNSSLTQVNRRPRFVQVPFKCKLSWLPLKKMNSYKRIAVSTTADNFKN